MDPLKAQPPQEAKLHFLDYWRIIRIRKTVIIAVFLLVVVTATLVTLILPESYSSLARIRVERDISDIQGFTERAGSAQFDPYFIQNEFELIRSAKLLDQVIEKLDLNAVWGRKYGNNQNLKTQETISLLKGRMSLRPVRNTSFIEIHAYSEDREEAAKIANTIAEVYQAYRTQERQRLSTGGIKSLKERYDELEDRIRQVQSNMEDLRQKNMISDADAAGLTPPRMPESDAVLRLMAAQIEKKNLLITLEKRVQQINSLSPEELKQVLPRMLQDHILIELINQLNIAEQRLIVLKNDFGPEHANVKNTQTLVDELRQKIDDNLRGSKTTVETQAAIARADLESVEKALEEVRNVDIEKAAKSRDYFDRKREFESLLQIKRMLDFKIAYENIDVNLPKTMVVEITDRAEPGQRPVRPNKPLNIFLGIVIGLVVGVGLAFFIEYLDTSVKTIDDVERALQAPVLGVIPQNVSCLFDEGTESPHAEAYRVLRTNLLFSRKDDKLNSVAIVSAGAGEGKSTTVLNLATVFAQSGQRVVIVDSDLRRPTLHKMLRLTNNQGLTNYLLKQAPLESVIQKTPVAMLDFLASGKLPSTSLGILSSAQMKDLIGELKQRYDFVFFDSPPIMGVSDASVLASEVDLTLQVIQYRRYPQPMNIRAKQLIEKVGGNLVGIVLNNINMSQDESYYYYSGYYHDYYSKNEEMTETSPSAGAASATGRPEIKQKY